MIQCEFSCVIYTYFTTDVVKVYVVDTHVEISAVAYLQVMRSGCFRSFSVYNWVRLTTSGFPQTILNDMTICTIAVITVLFFQILNGETDDSIINNYTVKVNLNSI